MDWSFPWFPQWLKGKSQKKTDWGFNAEEEATAVIRHQCQTEALRMSIHRGAEHPQRSWESKKELNTGSNNPTPFLGSSPHDPNISLAAGKGWYSKIFLWWPNIQCTLFYTLSSLIKIHCTEECLWRDWRDSLVVKSHSLRGPAFGTQLRHGGSQLMVTPIPGQPMPSSSLQRHTCGTQVHTQTHNFKKKSMNLKLLTVQNPQQLLISHYFIYWFVLFVLKWCTYFIASCLAVMFT